MAPRICIIGEVVVDVTLSTKQDGYKLRMGGIYHAARALWSLDAEYGLLFIAPAYLRAQICRAAQAYGAKFAESIGEVDGCPNVMLVGKAQEYGPQEYEYLLRDEHQSVLDAAKLREFLEAHQPTDVLIFPGGFDLASVLAELKPMTSNIYIDVNAGIPEITILNILERPLTAFISSTSTELFKEHFNGDSAAFFSGALLYAQSALLKENRGGSRFLSRDGGEPIRVPAQPRAVIHSVGVGDCYDAAFVLLRYQHSDPIALRLSACIATEYAATTYPEDYKSAVAGWLRVSPEEIAEIAGNSLTWEERSEINIYLAAPDFDFVNTAPLDELEEALGYHNFKPRRPVRENGQMGDGASVVRRQQLLAADLHLLQECELLIAVLLYDDPGTLIELGIAIERGLPVIVYDPYGRATNLFLTELPTGLYQSLDAVVTAVFTQAAKRRMQK